MRKISGIYIIKNKFNGKFYIGQSVDVQRRRDEHLRKLSQNSHENIKLQNAYNKYGANNFDFSILEEVDKECLTDREQYWIDKTNATINGYNINPIAEVPPSHKGLHFTDEHRHNLSLNSGNAREVICLETLKVYPSASKASAEFNSTGSHITGCCKNKYNTAFNLHWMYYNEYINADTEYIKSKLTKQRRATRSVLCVDTGVKYASITEASKKTGINLSSIRNCCNKIYQTAGGKQWEYLV